MHKKLIFIVVICFLILNHQIAWAESINSNIIRLHVIANSDSVQDQQLKLHIRDQILEQLSFLKQLKTNNDAKKHITVHLKDLEQKATEVIKKNGFDYQVKVKLTTSNFPTRKYHKEILPAGKYLALKVIIGEGKGANWWCVLYPPLCHGDWIREQERGKRVEENVAVPAFVANRSSLNNSKSKMVNIEKIINTFKVLIKQVYSISKSDG